MGPSLESCVSAAAHAAPGAPWLQLPRGKESPGTALLASKEKSLSASRTPRCRKNSSKAKVCMSWNPASICAATFGLLLSAPGRNKKPPAGVLPGKAGAVSTLARREMRFSAVCYTLFFDRDPVWWGSTIMASPILQVENLTKRYGDVEAVRGVSFSVEEGEVFGLLGPNGAGKTTTVEIL